MSDLTIEHRELRRFTDRARACVEMAQELGWRVQWQNSARKVARLISPSGQSTLNIPTTNTNANRAESWARSILRHSDPAKVADFTEKVGEETAEAAKEARHLSPKTALGLSEIERAVVDVRSAAKAAASDIRKTVVPQLVSSKPWMVRRGGQDGGPGTMYESPVVIHEVYDDGSERYRCHHCTYANENPRSVSAHASRSKDHPRTENQPTILRVSNYEKTDITREVSPNRRLVADLVSALDSIEDWRSMEPTALAELMSTAMVKDAPDRHPAEPLTDEQVVARIVSLVDNGRLAAMHQQIDAMAEQVRRVQSEVEAERLLRVEAEEKERHQRENMRALRELLSEEV